MLGFAEGLAAGSTLGLAAFALTWARKAAAPPARADIDFEGEPMSRPIALGEKQSAFEDEAIEAAPSSRPSEDEDVARREDERAARILEAVLFAAERPLDRAELAAHLGGDGAELDAAIEALDRALDGRGVRLERPEGRTFRLATAPDLAEHLARADRRARRPSRAALEVLAVIAYKQPVTRGDIEAARGVALARGTMDSLLEAGWIKPIGRRETPGRPMLWATTPAFLDAFDLRSLDDLPRLDELEQASLLRPVHEAEPSDAEPIE